MADEDTLVDKARGGHSLFAPSDSGRWMTCPGALLATRDIPNRAGIDAARGTLAHSVGQQWLEHGKPSHMLHTQHTIEGHCVEVDGEMFDAVGEYVAWCGSLPGKHLVEQRVDFSEYMPIPDQGGTADHQALLPGEMVITDLKYGVGVRVDAEENTQALLYALGAFLAWDFVYGFETITIRIAQPRLDHYPQWTVDRARLLEFAEYARERAALCMDPEAPRVPSEKACRFCLIRGTCGARAALLERLADDAFSDRVTPAEQGAVLASLERGFYVPARPRPLDLSTAHLAAIWRHKPHLSVWLDEVGKELRRRAISEEVVPGQKLVRGLTARKWKAPDEVGATLRAFRLPEGAVWPRALVSPAQAEAAFVERGMRKVDAEALVDSLVDRIAGPPLLVPEDDKRPAIVPDVELLYGDDDE